MRSYLRNPAEHPMFSGGDLVRMIIPYIAGFVMTLLVGMLDTAMVSMVSEEAVSGVSLVDNVMQLIVFVLNAFAMGGTIVAGQYLGNQDRDRACETVGQLVVLAAVLTVGFMCLLFVVRGGLMKTVFSDITAQVDREAQIYLTITLFSLPAMALFESSMAAFRAMGEAKTTMYVSLIMNLINVIGNAYLILIVHMGTAGVAWPTLISRWVGAILGMVLLADPKRVLHLVKLSSFRIRPELMGKILKVGLPNGVENGIFQMGKLLVLRLITGFGTQAIAANAVAILLTNVVSVPGWGLNQADMTVISRCVGANEYEQVRYYNRLLNVICSAVLLVWATLIILALPLLIPMFHLSAEAAALARGMVIIHAVGSIFIWGLAFLTPSSIRSAGDTTIVMIISVASMWLFRVGLAWILCHTVDLGLGALAVWIAMDADWLFRAAVYTWYWRSGRWMTHRVV